MGRMQPYVVKTGDHLDLLAHRMGFDADAVWNHSKNADLKRLRGSPNILCSGDVLYVPAPAPPPWAPATVGGTNRFVAAIPTVALNLTFSLDGKPVANADCIVHGLPSPNRFTTDGSGKLAIEVPVVTQLLTVEFPKVPLVRRIKIGHLDPSTAPSGIVQRLRSLGYFSPRTAVSGSDSDALARALSAFQRDQGLPATGQLDAATQRALEKAHGC
jgi:hypothetical protein